MGSLRQIQYKNNLTQTKIAQINLCETNSIQSKLNQIVLDEESSNQNKPDLIDGWYNYCSLLIGSVKKNWTITG